MPIYMDRHNTGGLTTAEIAAAHEADIAIQSDHEVKFLTYWFDQKRGAAFCLVDAPDEISVTHVHSAAHGNVPTDITEVELDMVQAFLGRTEDPEDSAPSSDRDQSFNIDSAFRSIMFTDLKDSTALSLSVGDVKAMELLDKHDAMIRAALNKNGGREIKHTGDGILSSFVSVDECLACAIDIQRSFEAFNSQKPEVPLHIRVGINAGEPIERGGDLFGMVVQLASRICDQANPNQILVSGIIPELCDDTKTDIAFVDAGQVPMKGFIGAIQLFEVGWAQK